MPKISFVLSLLGAKGIFLLVCFGASAVGVKATSSDAFCFLCHEMQSYRQELLQSSHAKDSRGQLIGCSRCHIPNGGIFPMLQAKVSLGFRDTWAHYANGGKIGNRQALQVAARDYIADSNCRTCHQDLLLNAAGTGPVSDKGRREHTIYLKNNPHPDKGSCSRCHGRNSAKKMRNTEIKGCVSCHEQLAHKRSMLQKTADKTRETAGKAYDATRSFLTE